MLYSLEETWPVDASVPLKWHCVYAVLFITIALYIHLQQLEVTARLDFIWKSQVRYGMFTR